MTEQNECAVSNFIAKYLKYKYKLLFSIKKEMEQPKKKRHRWCEDDDVEIIAIWEEREQELRKAKRNSHVYSQMAEKTNGKFTAKEVHTKIKNLCSRYR